MLCFTCVIQQTDTPDGRRAYSGDLLCCVSHVSFNKQIHQMAGGLIVETSCVSHVSFNKHIW